MELSLHLEKVCYKKKCVLSNIHFTAPAGKFTAIIGRNGCGKSTIVSCIGGLLPYDGEITLDGGSIKSMSPKDRASRIGIMLQRLHAPHITVRALAVFGRNPYLGIAERLSAADREKIDMALAETELTELADCYLDRISGGELRRAYLCMTLVQDTEILVLDEASANMDIDHEMRFMHALHNLCTKGKTILAVMHNLEQAMTADQIVLLDNGKQLFTGTPKAFLEEGWSERVFNAVPIFVANGQVFFMGKTF